MARVQADLKILIFGSQENQRFSIKFLKRFAFDTLFYFYFSKIVLATKDRHENPKFFEFCYKPLILGR